MPELIEVEFYRQVADRTVGRRIAEVVAPDAWFCKGTEPEELVASLTGQRVIGTRRRGKLLMVDTEGPVLGLRFGMTGRLLVDGAGPIAKLEYTSGRDDPAWHRFALRFDGSAFGSEPVGAATVGEGSGGDLVVVDPRRLGGVELDPDEAALGPDAASITLAQLRSALAGSQTALKARLLDQKRVAGIGNLICDETLWRAGLDPVRSAGSLDDSELKRLQRHVRSTIALLTERGGSHTGDLQEQRSRVGVCPKCGTSLDRRTVGGRTTFSCPRHQG